MFCFFAVGPSVRREGDINSTASDVQMSVGRCYGDAGRTGDGKRYKLSAPHQQDYRFLIESLYRVNGQPVKDIKLQNVLSKKNNYRKSWDRKCHLLIEEWKLKLSRLRACFRMGQFVPFLICISFAESHTW